MVLSDRDRVRRKHGNDALPESPGGNHDRASPNGASRLAPRSSNGALPGVIRTPDELILHGPREKRRSTRVLWAALAGTVALDVIRAAAQSCDALRLDSIWAAQTTLRS